MPGTIAAVASALPEQSGSQEELWDFRFRHHYGDDAAARRVWLRCGVERRHGVVDPIAEGVAEWGTGQRMARFVEEALPLGRLAIERALARAAAPAEEVDLLAVVSCTGYATPGLDILLARDLGMRDDVERVHIGHMGCYAALPALVTVGDAATARGRLAVLLCVELTTLHVQPAVRSLEQIVAHALFGDAAAATVVRGGGPGLELLDAAARTDTSTASLMTWDVTDRGFRMGLSPKVPAALRDHVAPLVDALLARNGLERGRVDGWVVHPGGPAIVDAVGESLELPPEVFAVSREVLRDAGNCSSPTVLLILERMLARGDVPAGGTIVVLAFGPGLTLYGCLLRAASRSGEVPL
ncbi:MAG: type III polyketide synthase [Actinomycetota bacterium]|nr:type III polyketide synthase [Actinomycetota bacterium]